MSKNIYRYCDKCKYSAPAVDDTCSVCTAKLMRAPPVKQENKKKNSGIAVVDDLISLLGL